MFGDDNISKSEGHSTILILIAGVCCVAIIGIFSYMIDWNVCPEFIEGTGTGLAFSVLGLFAVFITIHFLTEKSREIKTLNKLAKKYGCPQGI